VSVVAMGSTQDTPLLFSCQSPHVEKTKDFERRTKGIQCMAHLRGLLRLRPHAGHPQIASSDSGFPAIVVQRSVTKPHSASRLYSSPPFLSSTHAATERYCCRYRTCFGTFILVGVGLGPTVSLKVTNEWMSREGSRSMKNRAGRACLSFA
jgi:hypothetical protein